MKTRPINNSVRKWAERTKSGAKSIVEWLRIGGQNNRAAIERIESKIECISASKRTRSQRRKRKVGTVYNIFHNETNISEWFLFPTK